MAVAKFISTTSEKLDDISIVKGQLIFTTDGQIYWDYSATDRVKLTDITILPTESSKPASPVGRFYYFKDTSAMYYYNAGDWHLIGKDIEARITNLEYVTSWHNIVEEG